MNPWCNILWWIWRILSLKLLAVYVRCWKIWHLYILEYLCADHSAIYILYAAVSKAIHFHEYRQTSSIKRTLVSKKNCWSLRCSWSIACRRCPNYIFILDLITGFNGLGKGNCKMRRELSNFCDLLRRILEIRWYIWMLFCEYVWHVVVELRRLNFMYAWWIWIKGCFLGTRVWNNASGIP